MPVPTLALAKANTGLPPKEIVSPTTLPSSEAVPVAEATVVSSYTLSLIVIPEMVNAFAVISADKVGWVKVYLPASVPEMV